MIDLKTLFLSPGGRVGRLTYVNAVVLLVAANLILGLVPFFGTWLTLVMLWPFSCVCAKRLHDAGRSAWPVAVVAALCFGSGVLSAMLGTMVTDPAFALTAFELAGTVLMLGGIGTLAAIALLVWAGIKPGDRGANAFGDPEPEAFDLRMLLPADRR